MKLKILQADELTKKVAVVVGTRPGIIKFSPVIRALEKKCDFFLIHTGQHYSYNMDKQFFKDLNLPEPMYKNELTKQNKLHGAQTAEMLRGIEAALVASMPSILVVGGDANTNLAGALAARKLRIPVAHMEAGLRSDDWSMPEEHNRIIIDHISEILFTPTEATKQNLLKDNVKGEISIVGNSIVDAVYQNLDIAKSKSNILNEMDVHTDNYFIVTIHREENVDSMHRLENLLNSFEKVAEKYNMKILFPIHPRTINRIKEFNFEKRLKRIKNLIIVDALGYLDFLLLLANAKLVLTDSGGIQEECCILRIPCVTLRDNTERPETISVGANEIAGTEPVRVLRAVDSMLSKKKDWNNPFGKGDTGEKMAVRLSRFLEDGLLDVDL